MDKNNDEVIKSNIYKANGIAVGYSKGNKIDPNIQDKFCILWMGILRFFWLLMDMDGPYGNILAKCISDKIFKVLFIYFTL
jgi:hypothetical protein